jgi:P4 family phage/plasmid primase-like protien
MTAAAAPSPKELYPLIMDEFPEPVQEAIGAQKVPAAPKPATPAKVQQNQPVKPPRPPAPAAPVVNQIPAALVEFLDGLNQECRNEIKKYASVPNSQLEIPTEKRATAILAAFHKKYTTVPAGQRNTTLFLYSCTLRRCGLSEPEIRDGLWAFSRDHCKPPHSQSSREDVTEISNLAIRVVRDIPVGFPKTEVTEQLQPNPAPLDQRKLLTTEIEALILENHINTAIAKSLNKTIGNAATDNDLIRYCTTEKTWFVWDGTRWLKDERSNVLRLAWDHVCELMIEASRIRNVAVQHQLIKAQSNNEIKNSLNLLISLVSVTSNDFDKDDVLLNCLNGTIDLQTGIKRDFDRKDMITRMAPVPYVPGAKCPKWDSHLALVFENDDDLIKAFQRVMGYALVGGNGESKLFILFGRGKNGKSVTVNTIGLILGDYTINADASTFYTRTNPEAARGDIARMKGRRMVTAAEGKSGKFLDEGLIKNLTGGDEVTARFPYGREFDFIPTAKLLLHTNHLPRIQDRDDGIWRRPYPIPFTAVIPEDKRVKDYDRVLFSEEGSGILNWMLAGLADYQLDKKLLYPKKVLEALNQYKQATDILAEFLEGFIITGSEADTTSRNDLWIAYKLSIGTDNPFSKSKFNSMIEERLGAPAKRSNAGYVWVGIRTKQDADRQAELVDDNTLC